VLHTRTRTQSCSSQKVVRFTPPYPLTLLALSKAERDRHEHFSFRFGCRFLSSAQVDVAASSSLIRNVVPVDHVGQPLSSFQFQGAFVQSSCAGCREPDPWRPCFSMYHFLASLILTFFLICFMVSRGRAASFRSLFSFFSARNAALPAAAANDG
jgi:hypothetical protein